MEKEVFEYSIERFIELLTKWKNHEEDMTWGEVSEMRNLNSTVSDEIKQYWREWSTHS